MNKLTTEHAIDVADLLSPANQPMADISDASPKRKNGEGWFMRMAEASYEAWLKNGSHSYGL